MPAPLPEARLLEMVFPDHTNHLGTLFGGQALAWMDKAAFIVASRHARRIVVTARSEEVNFRVPVRKSLFKASPWPAPGAVCTQAKEERRSGRPSTTE